MPPPEHWRVPVMRVTSESAMTNLFYSRVKIMPWQKPKSRAEIQAMVEYE